MNDQKVGLLAIILTGIVVLVGLGYLIVVGWASWGSAAKKRSCIIGSPLLVYPGPGDTSPSAYWEGSVTFDEIDHAIDWKMRYGGLGPILAIDILGPVPPNASPTTDAPVYLTLCGPPSLVMCVSPEQHLLKQRIKQSSPQLQFLDTYITAIVGDRPDYLIRIRTSAHPDGALAARLNTAC